METARNIILNQASDRRVYANSLRLARAMDRRAGGSYWRDLAESRRGELVSRYPFHRMTVPRLVREYVALRRNIRQLFTLESSEAFQMGCDLAETARVLLAVAHYRCRELQENKLARSAA
jgi:hypothetical protein